MLFDLGFPSSVWANVLLVCFLSLAFLFYRMCGRRCHRLFSYAGTLPLYAASINDDSSEWQQRQLMDRRYLAYDVPIQID